MAGISACAGDHTALFLDVAFIMRIILAVNTALASITALPSHCYAELIAAGLVANAVISALALVLASAAYTLA